MITTFTIRQLIGYIQVVVHDKVAWFRVKIGEIWSDYDHDYNRIVRQTIQRKTIYGSQDVARPYRRLLLRQLIRKHFPRAKPTKLKRYDDPFPSPELSFNNIEPIMINHNYLDEDDN